MTIHQNIQTQNIVVWGTNNISSLIHGLEDIETGEEEDFVMSGLIDIQRTTLPVQVDSSCSDDNDDEPLSHLFISKEQSTINDFCGQVELKNMIDEYNFTEM